MAEYFHAVEPFSIRGRSGLPRTFLPAEVVSSDDPDFKGREQMFEPVSASVERGAMSRSGGGRTSVTATETATSSPGERRVRSTTVDVKPGPVPVPVPTNK